MFIFFEALKIHFETFFMLYVPESSRISTIFYVHESFFFHDKLTIYMFLVFLSHPEVPEVETADAERIPLGKAGIGNYISIVEHIKRHETETIHVRYESVMKQPDKYPRQTQDYYRSMQVASLGFLWVENNLWPRYQRSPVSIRCVSRTS